MLGLMEPESLKSSGYEIPESSGVRDKLDISVKIFTTIGALGMSDPKFSRIPVSMMFVCAAGYAPVRAAARQAMEVATLQDIKVMNDADTYEIMRKLMVSTLLIGITTLVIASYTSWKLCQQRSQPQTQDKSTQTSTPHDHESERAQDAIEEIYVYPHKLELQGSHRCEVATATVLEVSSMWVITSSSRQ
eukprot:1597698-Amphidinium_carterae.1